MDLSDNKEPSFTNFMHINIISRSNGVGLDQDAKLIQSALEADGMSATLSHCRAIAPWAGFIGSQKEKYDVNIFLERCFPRWFHTATVNLLIPNQERFPERHLKHLKRIDAVLCKSQHALEIFQKHQRSEFIGFSSPDRNCPEINPDYQSVIHLAGKSTLKGTEDLLGLWGKHPEWPTLTLIQYHSNAPDSVPKNVELISKYLSNDELSQQLNHHGIHLCPSRSEGWGHYIVEAMSCSAVVVTTDAPPMNELVTAERGVLVPYTKTEPRHLGTNFYINEGNLEQQLSALFKAQCSDKAQLGLAARQWFDENHARFSERLPEVARQVARQVARGK